MGAMREECWRVLLEATCDLSTLSEMPRIAPGAGERAVWDNVNPR